MNVLELFCAVDDAHAQLCSAVEDQPSANWQAARACGPRLPK